MDDAALIARVLAGDTDSFAVLVERYQRMIFALAMGFLRDRDLADDATQLTFVRAYERLQGFRGDATFKTWLHAIAANECRSLARRARVARTVDLDDVPDAMLAMDAPDRDPAEQDRLAGLVDRLPARQRSVVALRVYSDLPFKEIARSEGISENAAKVNFHHAIKRLRGWLRGDDR